MKVIIDENLPPSLARALDALSSAEGDHTVKHASEIVQRGTKDVDLFKALKDGGFLVHVSQDHHHRKPIERKSIASAGLIVFVLNKSWATQEFWPKTAQLVRWWPYILAQAARMTPPAAFRIPWPLQGQGKFEQLRL